jgi:uncharacterized protein YeaO (DUF488 family)
MVQAKPSITRVRAYDLSKTARGARVLVDRLWPRGASKAGLKLDAWLKDVAPSTELRKWFHENPETRFREFRRRYLAELRKGSKDLDQLLDLIRQRPVLLIYGARDPEHNHAVVLQDFLERTLKKS